MAVCSVRRHILVNGYCSSCFAAWQWHQSSFTTTCCLTQACEVREQTLHVRCLQDTWLLQCCKPLVLCVHLVLLLPLRLLRLLSAVLQDIALDGLVYWVPMLVHALLDGDSVSLSVHSKSSGSGEQKHCGGKSSQLHAVLLSSIPFGTAAAAALLLGHSSEKRQERRMHVGLPLLMGGCAFMLLPLLLQLGTHVPAFIAVTAAVVAADATTGPFWVSA